MQSVEGDSIRVLVVDDHDVFATSLARTLATEPGLTVMDPVVDRTGALAAAETEPDVILMDFRLGGANGVEVAREILRRHQSTQIVMLTASSDETVLASALEAGCAGFVTKHEPLERVVQAVRGAAAGEAVITPHLLARLLPRLSHKRGRGRNPELTPREREVLELVTRGLSNQQIADELVLSRDTVRNHISSILSKLDAHSKLQAAAIAVQRGLVSLGQG
jgi:DNA-binding NarL/FixJ family response regulator